MKLALSRKNLWDASPAWLKQTIGAALKLAPPAMVLGGAYRKALADARASESWTVEQVRERQVRELRAICELAYEKSEFYRGVMQRLSWTPAALQEPEDIRALPLIDKATLREQGRAMCVRPIDGRDVDEVSTGGSSGQPLKFYIQAGRSAVEFAYLVAGWERIGFRFGDTTAVFRGAVVPSKSLAGLRHSYDPLLRRHFYSNFHMADADMRAYLSHLATLGPCWILVYPSSGYALARFILDGGHKPLTNIRGILAGSETTYPGQREACEQAFNAPYFTWYGHSEKLALAAECAKSSDYHVWPGYGFVELVDDAGKPVTTPGVSGEIVGTGFINRVMPFLRYRTGDWATYVGERCEACGRNHLVIRGIEGHRTQEMLIASDGTAISWVAMNMHDDTFEDVRQFQFRQDEPGRALLRIVAAPAFGDAHVARILRNLDRKFAGRMQITIERVDEIPLTARGKTVYVDQRLKLDGAGRLVSPTQQTAIKREEVHA